MRSREAGETFHPVIGPVAEAEALYVRQLRLVERARAEPSGLVLWDVGLGAAANVLTVLRALQSEACPLTILSFDQTLDPLRFGLLHADPLGYFGGYEKHVERLLANRAVSFRNKAQWVNWRIHEGDFPSLALSDSSLSWPKPHAILFDAYSPARNPAMWTLPLFSRLHDLLDPNRACVVPTYSRSTMLRVTLLLAGFFVGSGRATGEKEETTFASNRAELVESPLDNTWLERVRRSTSAEPLHEPTYRQAPLATASLERIERHPQFVAGLKPRPEAAS